MNETLPVLDKGFVRLISSMGDDLSIVQDARQSYDAAWRAGENEGGDTRLIRYLMRHRHSTPFEGVVFKFEVKAPIFVMRQWTRHRTWTYITINEVSGRYRKLAPEFYVPDPARVGRQAAYNKQARELIDLSADELTTRQGEAASYTARCNAAFREYEWLIDRGWPRELARCVLPLSTYTHLRVKVDLWNLLHFLDLRSHEAGAQLEICDYAQAMAALIEPIVPVTMAAWREYGRQSHD